MAAKRPPLKVSDKIAIKGLKPRHAGQAQVISAVERYDICFILGPAGSGKAQPMYSTLYTRDGPIRMGDVRVGDQVANADGGFSTVTGVFPQGEKEICRVHFVDGSHVDACEEHLWIVEDGRLDARSGDISRIATTKSIENSSDWRGGRRPISVPCPKPVGFPERTFVIDPYTMGILIAEGGLTNFNVVFSSNEQEVVDRVVAGLPEGLVVKSRSRDGAGLDHRIVKAGTKMNGSQKNPYKQELVRLGMWGKYAHEKRIHADYLHASVGQRTALLQAMMDGDGYICVKGNMSYNTTSRGLADDFCYLVRSLGGTSQVSSKAGSRKPDGTRHRESYNCHFRLPESVVPFTLARKLARMEYKSGRRKFKVSRRVDYVERLGRTEMQCISVDNKRHLYLTDQFVVTHNTHAAVSWAISAILSGLMDDVVVTRPMVECGESMGYLPGDERDKVGPYLMPIRDVLCSIVGKQHADAQLKKFQAWPLGMVRGRTVQSGTVAILDEAQNASITQLHAYLTRIGTGGKMFVCGDTEQSDTGGGRWLEMVAAEMEKDGLAAVVRFTDEQVVRSKLITGINKVFRRIKGPPR